MARSRRRRRPPLIASTADAPPMAPGVSAAGLRLKLESDPRFRVLSVDGLNWIDPYTGTLVQAPFDWQEGALGWLLENRPWRKHQPRAIEQLQRHRWRIHLRGLIADDPRFRHFDHGGRWLNPYDGTWVTGVRREGKTINGDTLQDMAGIIAACPEAEGGDPLGPHRIDTLVQAAKRAHAAASGPAPVVNAPHLAGGGMRIRGRRAPTASSDEHATRRAINASDLIAGYRVIGRLGTGGMSAVYRARQDSDGREVALKVLQAHGERAESFAERFILEAKAAGAISHPNVVTVYDFGKHDGKLYMTMELMPGGDVESLLKRGPLPERRALELIRDATAGLIALHEAQIIHRDIKPSNIFIDEAGVAKIGDLGLAKQTGNESNITVDGAAVGTPAFMAPEQARGDSLLDQRVDIYGMGASLYMLLTGRPPYLGGNVFTVVRRVLSEPIPDVRQRNGAVTKASAQIIATATAKDADARFTDASAMLTAVEEALETCGDAPPQVVDRQAQTATIRRRLADHVSTEHLIESPVDDGRLTPSHEHVALERRVDPLVSLEEARIQLGLFEARVDSADHHALRMLGDRPLLLLVHTAGIDPDLREELTQGLDALIDDVVAAAPDSTGELFSRFHRHLRKAGLPQLGAIAIMLSASGEEACVSVADLPPPCRFGDPAAAIDLKQVGFRDEALGADERSSRESWVDIPPGGGIAVVSPGVLAAEDAEGTAYDLPHLVSSLVLNADLGAQEAAEAMGEDLDAHAEGRLRRDATIMVLKRLPS